MAEQLPLGAVRTAGGDVVVPASRRADGSTRKPIRIRQGYVPQDEVPKYKTVAQRADDAVDALPLEKLSLGQKGEQRPRGSARVPRQERGERQSQKAEAAKADSEAKESAGDRQQQLKRQLTKINKQLKEIAKLQDAETSSLTQQQEQKVARKSALQQQRSEIIAELNGATVTKSSASATGLRPKVAISL
ncbi:unnamed protein product [Phytophthora lilii]|uniref:Unnamed protein product n=1 Tax=Phytophthora lilii TaxID=2077276 RepID=A0A9W6TDE2_9STRA|nr:unnamed protein product [Phytophthora lilii]